MSGSENQAQPAAERRPKAAVVNPPGRFAAEHAGIGQASPTSIATTRESLGSERNQSIVEERERVGKGDATGFETVRQAKAQRDS